MALGLDLTIRAATSGKKSLDDVMRALWTRYGRDFYSDIDGAGQGIALVSDQLVRDSHLGADIVNALDAEAFGECAAALERLRALQVFGRRYVIIDDDDA